jgi:hypothetical protein
MGAAENFCHVSVSIFFLTIKAAPPGYPGLRVACFTRLQPQGKTGQRSEQRERRSERSERCSGRFAYDKRQRYRTSCFHFMEFALRLDPLRGCYRTPPIPCASPSLRSGSYMREKHPTHPSSYGELLYHTHTKPRGRGHNMRPHLPAVPRH